MLILKAGLYLALAVTAYVVWASSGAGYSIEVALLRGAVAFMGVTFVAYLAEIVVMTAPVAGHPAQSTDREGESENDPVHLSPARAEREAAADQRRAA